MTMTATTGSDPVTNLVLPKELVVRRRFATFLKVCHRASDVKDQKAFTRDIVGWLSSVPDRELSQLYANLIDRKAGHEKPTTAAYGCAAQAYDLFKKRAAASAAKKEP